MNSQTERTRLAWRRTILAVLVVGGVGAVHLATAGLLQLAVLATVVTVLGCVPAVRRLAVLRNAAPVATWEPLVLAIAGCLMATSVFVTG